MWIAVSVICPHCNKKQEINIDSADDSKDEIFYCQKTKCRKRFIIEPSWSVVVEVFKVEEK